jgi:GNAT superfamily N-acetyltransferase
MPDQIISLRAATTEDLPALLGLMDSVLAWLVEQGQTEQWGELPFSRIPGFPERVREWVTQGVITLAERGDRCVGLLALAPQAPPRIPEHLIPDGAMFLHTVMSDRGDRGRGVGSTLMDEAERRARAVSAPVLALDHWAGNADLARIYESRGYRAVGVYDEEHDGSPNVRNVVRVLPLR